MNDKQMIQAARDDISFILHMLVYVSAGGPRAKPTVAQLNDMVTRLENADYFLKATQR